MSSRVFYFYRSPSFDRLLIFPFRRLMVQFDAVAQTSFFKYRLSSMYLYLPVKER